MLESWWSKLTNSWWWIFLNCWQLLKLWWLCLELNGELLNIVETFMIILEMEWWIVEWLWLSSTNLELQCEVLKWWWIWTFVRVMEWREWWEIVRKCKNGEKLLKWLKWFKVVNPLNWEEWHVYIVFVNDCEPLDYEPSEVFINGWKFWKLEIMLVW